MKMTNERARKIVNRDYYGDDLDQVQDMWDIDKCNTSLNYYSGRSKKIRIRDIRTGEIVKEYWD